MSKSRILTAALVAVLALATAASASALIYPKLLSPRANGKTKVRHAPTFVVRDTAPKRSFNNLYLSVSPSRKLNRCGVLKNTTNGVFDKMHRKKHTKHTYVDKPKFYDYPATWLNRPRTYYWQVYRIDSGAKCDEVKSKIRKIRVVR